MTAQEQAKMRDLVARLTLAEKRCDELEAIVRRAPTPEQVQKLHVQIADLKARLRNRKRVVA